MKRLLKIEISSCAECPYCQYDPNYNCGRDSGWDCTIKGKRVIDDCELKKYRSFYDVEVPDWCPLPVLDE